jgi:hypothetical protein
MKLTPNELIGRYMSQASPSVVEASRSIVTNMVSYICIRVCLCISVHDDTVENVRPCAVRFYWPLKFCVTAARRIQQFCD